ncbi:hypothetical protein [Acholeplasma hippikon]|uniref:Uncharacterized protein n=1 Tax=Acholeplasma hippikon TaxID=264636 RepID=A0A449BK29_9MOLU|nr:hypothetical protein [Acholeplasma hippikon]VEU82826.1 Uncharacterised protein [Acholeplasma hippikon]
MFTIEKNDKKIKILCNQTLIFDDVFDVNDFHFEIDSDRFTLYEKQGNKLVFHRDKNNLWSVFSSYQMTRQMLYVTFESLIDLTNKLTNIL